MSNLSYMTCEENLVMPIVTTNPAVVTIQLLDKFDLSQEQIFKLAHCIDAYEIENKLQDSLVIDIYNVTKEGMIELLLTPKSGMRYDELSEHLTNIISNSLKRADLAECRWELTKITFQTKVPGKASYVFDEPHAVFRSD